MAQPAPVKADSQASPTRLFAIDAARMLANTRCRDVVLLDARGLSPVTDYMILATGTSPRQMQTACEDVEELGQPRGFRALSRAGDSGRWTCIDMVDVVVHVFNHDARSYYDLDNLWGDARKVPWQEAPPSEASPTSAPAPAV